MSRILIIEDEENLAKFVDMELKHEGYETDVELDGRAGLDAALNQDFDVILLDLMLPELNGIEVARRVREVKDTPIIIMTARDSVIDRVSGLDHGADDYIVKPFAIEELLARIRTVLRKAPPARPNDNVLAAKGVELDPASRQVTVRGTPVDLTKREFDLLQFLLENKGIVLSRETILEKVWGFDFEGETNAVDVYVRFLRGKIDEVFGIKLILTIRGVGYVIRDE